MDYLLLIQRKGTLFFLNYFFKNYSLMRQQDLCVLLGTNTGSLKLTISAFLQKKKKNPDMSKKYKPIKIQYIS